MTDRRGTIPLIFTGPEAGREAVVSLTQGIPLRVVMETLGHSQISTTADVYSHVLPVLMADAAHRMDEALTTL